ncbi:MAG: PEP-CTERM system TPR-repeat protein PrsT [Proteobacteria bacterium]|nr:PEP-CTERM system TPR-repeat protein PrsT [Pseudomonadota bacterium]
MKPLNLRSKKVSSVGYRKRARDPGARPVGYVLAICLLVGCSSDHDPAELLSKGNAYVAAGDLASAIIELKNAVQGAPDNSQARFALGSAYLASSNFAAATKELTRARTLGTRSPELNLAIAKALILSGKLDEAATELALNLDDTSSEWLTLQGLVDLSAGRYAEANTTLKMAIELDSSNVDAYRASIRAAIALGDALQARNYIEASLKVTQDDFEIWLLKGDLDQFDKKMSDALTSYSRALDISLNNPLGLLRRAAVQVSLAQPDEALVDLDAMGAASEEHPQALYLRALIARQKKEPSNALRYLRQVLTTFPDHKESLAQAAAIHFEQSEYADAERYLDRLIEFDPGNKKVLRMLSATRLALGKLPNESDDSQSPEVDDMSDPQLLALLGATHLKHGNIAQGRKSLERALELAPGSVPIRTQIAFSKMRSGQVQEALDELTVIRSEAPNFVLASILQAFGFAAKEDTQVALDVANELVASDPESAIYYNVRGYLQQLFGNTSHAFEDFETALQKDPGFNPANFNLARLAHNAKDDDSARRRLETFLERTPNEPQALVYLASMQVEQGNTQAAIALLKQARDNNHDAPEPRIILSRLYRSSGDIAAAKSAAEEAFALAPYASGAQLEFAVTKLIAGEPELAMPAIEALVEHYPNSAKVLELHARAKGMSGDAQGYESGLAEIAQRFPSVVSARTALGKIYAARGEYAAAEKLADELIRSELVDIQVEGNLFLGDLKFAQGDMPSSLGLYQEAHGLKPQSRTLLKIHGVQKQSGLSDHSLLDDWLTANPNDIPVGTAVAIENLNVGQRDQAVSNYEIILEKSPDNLIALNNLAWIFDQSEDERALEFGRRAYEAAPNNPEVTDTYGWILLRKGRIEQGMELISRALKMVPANNDIRFHYATGLAKTNDVEGAQAELRKILSDDSPFSSRAEAEALLAELENSAT